MQPEDKISPLQALIVPVILLLAIWGVFYFQAVEGYNLTKYGLMPRSISDLRGILTTPFIHADLNHIMGNSIPLLFLSWCLFYFYPEISWRVLILIYIMGGAWVWLAARESYHIGASGIIYGLFAFLFTSGVIRKNSRLMVISLLTVFLYGSMVWGLLPIKEGVSWEGHSFGALAGLILAIFYKKIGGAPRKVYQWELDEINEKLLEEQQRLLDEQERQRAQQSNIVYHYKPKED